MITDAGGSPDRSDEAARISVEPQAIVDALPEVSFTGPRGEIQMNKQHHTPLTMYLGQVTDAGGVEVIKTFDNVDPGEQCPNL